MNKRNTMVTGNGLLPLILHNTDEYGFERPEDFNYQVYEEFMSSYLKILAHRSKKWSKLLNPNYVFKKNAKLKRYIRKGIPAEHRGFVWFMISGAHNLKKNMSDDFYYSLLKQDLNTEIVDAIKLDLHRTFPNNIFFKRPEFCQTQLFNILVAYAHHNPKIGYCQGLNYVAGLLLLVTKNEETTFWLLKTLIEQTLEDYYSPTMQGLLIDVEVLSEIIKMKEPEVHQHITNLGLPWLIICSKWFICLFVEILPIETVLRIWDCLFYEGSKIFFRVGIALIKLNRKQLIESKDFAEAANTFKSITNSKMVTNCHFFMNSVFKVSGSLSNSTLHKLRRKIRIEKFGSK
ncbi:gh regulated tbc protein-1, putative [Pediculus humanus corporis]|uniref:Growth hormone-regulated TBC protein 1 n=1 Tax=Pediculus humanus subsp. corporis TaxID=121224 RepID=E0VBX2_PEDHC|nr:gh regulated tbc protein-1, putative [Pediculus humanus corporis]EEB10878.1 gh regulated tbc protein-1, putative [Pediculus humanus corporis]